MANTFKLKATTIIESATLDLSAEQLDDFRTAEPLIADLVADARGNSNIEPATMHAADTVLDFLEAVKTTVAQTGIIRPKRKITRRKAKPKANPTPSKPPRRPLSPHLPTRRQPPLYEDCTGRTATMPPPLRRGCQHPGDRRPATRQRRHTAPTLSCF